MANMEYECCICKGWFEGWGNNPWPAVKDEDAICCDRCNMAVVIPARIRQLVESCDGTEQSK